SGYAGHQIFLYGGSIIHTASVDPEIAIYAQVRLATGTVVDVQGDRELYLARLANGSVIGTPTLTKAGSGTLRLVSNPNNAFSGDVFVGGGTLQLYGSSLGASTVTVANGASLRVTDSSSPANVIA